MLASTFIAFLIPVALFGACFHLATSRQLRRRTWPTSVTALGLLILLADLHINWARSSNLLRPVLLLSYAAAVLISRWRLLRGNIRPTSSSYVRSMRRLHVAIIALCLGLLGWTFTGHLVPGVAAQLDYPLRDGTYMVVSGGASLLTNPRHWLISEQKYAVDLVKLTAFGSEAKGFATDKPKSFAIWHEPVLAPCKGTVSAAEDLEPDQELGQADVPHAAGNSITLECDGYLVMLAHLAHGSFKVRVGQSVDAGTPLAKVGLSGNTLEPHLHVQVMYRDGEQLVSAPFLIHGSFPVKNRLIFAR